MSEPHKAPDLTQLPALTEESRDLLRRALQGEEISEEEPGFAHLDRLGVLVPESYRPGVYVMAERSHIEERLHRAAEQQVSAGAAFMAGIRPFLNTLDQERAQYGRGGRTSYESYFIHGIDGVHAVIESLTYTAEDQIRAVQPGKRSHATLADSKSRDMALMKRGVVLRTIYQRVNLPLPHVRRYVADLTAVGARFRLTDAPLEKMVMIDRAHVFIPDTASGRDHTAGAWHIRDPAAIGYLARLFENEWLRASPWSGTEVLTAEGAAPEASTTPRQRFILRGICSGQSYEQIGRLLGIKERTVGEAMAQLRKQKGLETNEQLAFWFATSPDRTIVD